MLLILTMIACVEKLDEKEDIITACVTIAVYSSLVTIITPGSLMVTGHCMCGSNLRLRRTDQAPMTPAWSEPSRGRHGLTIPASHWSSSCRQSTSLANSTQPIVEAHQARLCAR